MVGGSESGVLETLPGVLDVRCWVSLGATGIQGPSLPLQLLCTGTSTLTGCFGEERPEEGEAGSHSAGRGAAPVFTGNFPGGNFITRNLTGPGQGPRGAQGFLQGTHSRERTHRFPHSLPTASHVTEHIILDFSLLRNN